MQPKFSFLYDGKPHHLPIQNGQVFAPEEGILVTACQTEYPAFGATEWMLSFENTSSENSGIFSDILDCDTLLPLTLTELKRPGYMPKDGDACIITMNGMVDGAFYWENDAVSATEFGFCKEFLDPAPRKTRSFANKDGRSSDGTMPFFDITALDCGYIAAIGWSGDWRAEFARCEGGIHIKTGLKKTNFYLKPGEKIRTTSILIMPYTATEDKYNKFRRLMKQHFSYPSCTPADRESLLAFLLWGGIPSEEIKKRISALKQHQVPFEEIWIDAGWYGNCTNCDENFTGDWPLHTGNWAVNPRVHPGELTDVAACVQDAGMYLMLWCEPERAISTTPIVQQLPEWFLSRSAGYENLLNLGNDAAWDYVFNLLSDYVEKLNLSCYRQDFNIDPSPFFRHNDAEDRQGISEIKHITGMYRLWDALLEKHPGLIIDNCASGGRRIDIETLKRSVPLLRTDYQCNFNENPEVTQVHNTNISRYLPYNGCFSKNKGDLYNARSAYATSWCSGFYNTIFRSADEEDFRWAKAVTEEYLQIRKYFSQDFYNHGSAVFDDTAWTVWQYHDPQSQSGIVMAFRRSNSPFAQLAVELKGLEAGKTYGYTNLNTGATGEFSHSIPVELPQKRSSVIFQYAAK